MNASEIMRTAIATVPDDTTFLDAVRMLLATKQRALPVVDGNGSIVGIVSESDLVNCVEPDGAAFKSILETMSFLFPDSRDLRLEALTIRDVMTPNPVCIGEEDTVDEIVSVMTDHEIAQVPVVSGSLILGMVTYAELLSCIEHRMLYNSIRDVEHAA